MRTEIMHAKERNAIAVGDQVKEKKPKINCRKIINDTGTREKMHFALEKK